MPKKLRLALSSALIISAFSPPGTAGVYERICNDKLQKSPENSNNLFVKGTGQEDATPRFYKLQDSYQLSQVMTSLSTGILLQCITTVKPILKIHRKAIQH